MLIRVDLPKRVGWDVIPSEAWESQLGQVVPVSIDEAQIGTAVIERDEKGIFMTLDIKEASEATPSWVVDHLINSAGEYLSQLEGRL
jgi:hypothetical protein